MEFILDYQKITYNEIYHTIYQLLTQKIDVKVTDLKISGYVTEEPIPFKQREEGEYHLFKLGESWGKLFDCAWFLIEGKIEDFKQGTPYDLKLDLSGEACLFNEQGVPIKGFTNGSSIFDRSYGEPGKRYYPINEFIQKDGTVKLWIEAGCNDLFGSLQDNGVIQYCEVVIRNDEIKELFYDLEILYSLLSVVDDNTIRNKQILESLKKINYLIMYEEKDWLNRSLKMTKQLLSMKSSNDLEITAIGHAHLDLAWLWPIRETKRKAARTLSNVIDLLEKDDAFIFGVSQPQLLLWIKVEYPELYKKIKHYVKQNRIELQGGMWVEADTNLTGEESLVRQMLYGIQFYQEEFVFKVKNLWLPDVFGYTGSLPQVIKKSGLDYFMTIKLSWSLINKFPYHTFNWLGIDGSNVLCHMPPEGNYNSSITPSVTKLIEVNYKEKHLSNKALALFGIGDGGGGPGEEHIERIKRQKSLHPLPKVNYGRSDDFFNSIVKDKDLFSKYQGELYLENHQGTYTSQANVKFFNRKLEHKLKSIETLLVSNQHYQKYKEKLSEIWKEVLLYQFHDILPGSSIKRVYNETLARYEILDNQLDQLLKEVYPQYTVSGTFIYNPLLNDATVLSKIDNQYVLSKIAKLSSQVIETIVYEQDEVVTSDVIETNLLKVVFNPNNGQMTSIIDKVFNREILSKPEGNQLAVYQDKGDAWNILDHYRKQTPEVMTLMKRSVLKYGHLYEINHEYRFKESTLKETIIIRKNSTVIEFHHDLNWQNVGYMLRTSFPLTIKSSVANFDIQFGQIARSRLNNTTIESAQFEVSGHNWVNVSEPNYGVSLLNNAKYGYYVKDDMLDMNLLRSTNYPCENGDIDRTNYQYGLYVHEGNQNQAHVDALAMEMNTFFPRFNEKIDVLSNWISIDKENIDYSSIKGSEDNKGTIIRLYEKNGEITETSIRFTRELSKIYLVNLIEEFEEELNINNQTINISFKPFEIITLKIIK